MNEWDMEENLGSGIVSLTIYTPNYNQELSDRLYSFNVKEIYSRMPAIVQGYKKVIQMDDPDESEGLVGINSDSLNPKNLHNIFMEWDKKTYIPPIEKLKALGGTIIETGGGIHFIKEDRIQWVDLHKIMEENNCCPGFMFYSDRRKKACLRVCPKKDNYLRIIHKQNGSFTSLYEYIVKELHKEVSGVNS